VLHPHPSIQLSATPRPLGRLGDHKLGAALGERVECIEASKDVSSYEKNYTSLSETFREKSTFSGTRIRTLYRKSALCIPQYIIIE
jgi:hypothetical protein